jgi:hypothetical protein
MPHDGIPSCAHSAAAIGDISGLPLAIKQLL